MKENLLIEDDQGLICDPAVFDVGESYCVIFLTRLRGIGWVEAGGKEYGAETLGGLIRSDLDAHRIHVPKKALDEAGSYSVNFAPVMSRAPYWPKCGRIVSKTFRFRGIGGKKELNVYHLCDTHSHLTGPTAAAGYFGSDTDLFILNGDIPDHSGTIDQVRKIHELCANAAHGEVPILFSRGNHDTRGESALEFIGCTPNVGGDYFFTTRIGGMWTLVLDCGEDKPDASAEYGGMVAFDAYRRRETEFLKKINANAREEYLAEGVSSRVGVCHIPLFSDWNGFAADIYGDWLKELNKMGLDLMLCGHNHTTEFFPDGADTLFGRMEFPVAVGGRMEGRGYVGTALRVTPGSIELSFTDSEKKVRESHTIKLG